jgi:hypothetical protein
MRTSSLLRSTAIVAALTATVLAPAATAAPRHEIARFRATLSGAQFGYWKVNKADEYCGTTTKGSGAERIRFRQARRVTLEFEHHRDGSPLLQVRVLGADYGIPVRGRITRASHVTTTPPTNEYCYLDDSESGGPPPPRPDCGTRGFRGRLVPGWSRPEHYPMRPSPLESVLWMWDLGFTSELFANCGNPIASMVMRSTKDTLTEKEVFGRKPRITLHDARDDDFGPATLGNGYEAETSVRWTLRLTRVR